MKHIFLLLLMGTIVACTQQTTNDKAAESYLVRVPGDSYEMGESFTYVNQNGNEIVPDGKYAASFTDTIRTYGVVAKGKELVAIDVSGKELYQVFSYDNGPDFIEDGLFRIVENGKIGYADGETGKVVIAPTYTCAFPFENGKAKVSLNCSEETIGEYSEWVSEEWIFIDKQGEEIAE